MEVASQERRSGLGGHDIAAICGVHPYRTAVQVYQEKVEGISTFDPNYQQRRALFLEDFMAAEFARKEGDCIVHPYIADNPSGENNVKPFALLVLRPGWKISHPEHPFFHSHPDFVLTEEGQKIARIVECKDPARLNPAEWGDEGEFTAYSKTVPDYITCQVAWYCLVADCENASLIVNDDFSLRHYTYKRDKAFEAILIEAGIKFWKEHILAKKMPEAKNLQDLQAIYPVASDDAVELEGETYDDIITLKSLQIQIKELEKKAEEKKIAIQKKMGRASEGTFNGIRVCTWKGYEVSRVNLHLLKEDFRDIYDELSESTYQRRFIVK